MEKLTELPRLAPRSADSNKGNFGKVLVVAGSCGMSGAAILVGTAALRGGAGLVRVATPASVLPIVAGGNPCYTTLPLPHDDKGRLSRQARDAILEATEANDVMAMGPGLGRSDDISELLGDLIGQVKNPLVLDADGLNAFEGKTGLLQRHAMPLIITPHPGEFSRLTQKRIKEIQNDRINSAAQFARDHDCVVVLKGHGTIVTDGKRLYQNTTGNAGMSTGGTGDVLTGLIAALVGQGLAPFAAAHLGVYLHGRAGDLACAKIGEVSLIASDVLDYLAGAFQQL